MKPILFALFVMPFSLLATNSLDSELAEAYIGNFKEIAVSEMHRTGIPASIKLAQGMLESNWGRSGLATTANNHFGIKCGGQWNGETYYKEDDDRDKRGRLIKSCFRSFDSAYDSYIAHSEFLTDPKKVHRYGWLFELAPTDYKGWANGLRKSGYATDRKYPQKLIKIIEQHELYQFDQTTDTRKQLAATKPRKKERKPASVKIAAEKANPTVAASSTSNRKSRVKRNNKAKTKKRMPEKYVSTLKYEILVNNETRVTKAQGGESLSQLSRRVGLPLDHLTAYNEAYVDGDEILAEGEYIYLERKKRKYLGEKEIHVVQEGETMFTIAQRYGIRLNSLYAKNRMPKTAETYQGIEISLKKTVALTSRPRFKDSIAKKRSTFLFDGQKM